MTRPRPKFKRRVAQLGRRTMGLYFRLKPSPETNRVFGYLLAHFLARHNVNLHAAVVMGNHYHLVVSAEEPTLDAFKRDFNSQLARFFNARERLVGVSLWAATSPGDIECLDPESAMDDVIYVALNPVEASIVPRPEQHPGLIILPSDWGETLTFDPPDSFFRYGERGVGTLTIEPTPPPGFDHIELEKLKREVTHEIEMRARRIRRSGRKFWGFDDVDIWDCPKSLWAKRMGHSVAAHFPSARFDTGTGAFDSCPRYQASNKSLLAQAHRIDESFQRAYRGCREAEKAGESDVVYPEGTAAYRQHNRATCAPLIDRGWYPLLDYL